MDSVFLSYVAGLVDGEGSFNIQLSVRDYKGIENLRFNPRMCIGMKADAEEVKLLDSIGKAFGLNVYHSNVGTDHHIIRIMGTNVDVNISFTNLILPYLKLKKEKAIKFLRVCELIKRGRDARYKDMRNFSKEKVYTKEEMIEIIEIATTMNIGKQSTRFRDSQSRNKQYFLDYINKLYPS